MKVTYIGHSGFAVELKNLVLLFDYYTGKLPEWPADKAIAVFSSHSHPDHFNWKILELYEQYPRIHYFFGNDIRLGEKWLNQKGIPLSIKEKVSRMAGGRTASWDDKEVHLQVSALKSTDMGVAFCVEAEGLHIFHAGDLNWWHWEGESDEENREMEEAFKREIDSISGQHFDLAFVPLDPRLEGHMALGMDYFLEKTDSPVVFPMHMWGKYEAVSQYKRRCPAAGRVMDIREKGQVWEWKL